MQAGEKAPDHRDGDVGREQLPLAPQELDEAVEVALTV